MASRKLAITFCVISAQMAELIRESGVTNGWKSMSTWKRADFRVLLHYLKLPWLWLLWRLEVYSLESLLFCSVHEWNIKCRIDFVGKILVETYPLLIWQAIVIQLRRRLNSSFRNSSFLLKMSLSLQLPAYQIRVGRLDWSIGMCMKQNNTIRSNLHELNKIYLNRSLRKIRSMRAGGDNIHSVRVFADGCSSQISRR
jgi:hypothetical protein